jgi:hypothetical protein
MKLVNAITTAFGLGQSRLLKPSFCSSSATKPDTARSHSWLVCNARFCAKIFVEPPFNDQAYFTQAARYSCSLGSLTRAVSCGFRWRSGVAYAGDH